MPDRMGWIRWLRGLITLRKYHASWLMHDIAAGLVLATMLVPVGIAYAVASGVPGIYGLYATIVPLLAYALYGPSRILVSRTRLSASGHHPWRCFSAISRQRPSRRSSGWHDGGRLRPRVYCGGCCSAWLRNRTSFQAYPL